MLIRLFFNIIFSFLLFQNTLHADEFDDVTIVNSYPDPHESINRKIFAFNEIVLNKAVYPILGFYRKIPSTIRQSFANASETIIIVPLNTTFSFASQQGEIAGNNISRFVINMTFGFFGFVDAATAMGVQKESFDLGDLMTYYNIPSGNYVMLPFLGPSNYRNAASIPMTFFLSSGSIARIMNQETPPMFWFAQEDTLFYTLTSDPYDTIISQSYIWSVIDGLEKIDREISKMFFDKYIAYRVGYYGIANKREKYIKTLQTKNNIKFDDNKNFAKTSKWID